MNTLLISFIISAASALNGADAGHGKVITRLVGHHQTITITATGNGPRYSVMSAGGQVLLANATLDELREKQPDCYRQIRSSIASHREVTATVDLD